MRTKTLLIAVATLAAGVATSMAQVTYSQNVVGYVNVVATGNNALTMIANPLLGPSGTNGATQVLTGLNQGAGGETLFIWTGAGYRGYVFAGAGVGTGLGFPSDWYDSNGGAPGSIPGDIYDSNNGVYWVAAAPQLNQGQGAFLQNPYSTAETNTFVGTVVLQNTNTPVVLTGNNGLSLVASTVPVGGAISNAVFNLPFNVAGGETVFLWTGSGYHGYVFAGPGVGTGLGFASDYYDANGGVAGAIPGDIYDSNNGVYWVAAPPAAPVGTGFFVQNPYASSELWTQNLILQ